VLSRRTLNRTLLQQQMLLQRAGPPAAEGARQEKRWT
jgi:hypothetical protein